MPQPRCKINRLEAMLVFTCEMPLMRAGSEIRYKDNSRIDQGHSASCGKYSKEPFCIRHDRTIEWDPVVNMRVGKSSVIKSKGPHYWVVGLQDV